MIGILSQKLGSTTRKAFINTGWAFFDRIFRMVAAMVIGVWVARYLGPAQFGLLTYASIFPTVLIPFTGLGLANVLVMELVQKKNHSESQLMGTAFGLKLVAGVLAFLIISVLAQVLYADQPLLRSMILYTSSILVCQSIDVIDVYFQSEVKSRYSVIAKSIAFLITTGLRVYFLANQFGLLAFSFLVLVEVTLSVLMLIVMYNREGLTVFQWKFDRALSHQLLRRSWPVMLSEFFIFIYMRADQYMLKELASDTELGKYSAALRLSEVWYFIAMALNASYYPTIAALKVQDEKAFRRNFQRLLAFLLFISISISVVISLSAPVLTRLLFGEQYTGVDQILVIHIWSGVFVFLGVGTDNWFILHNQQRLLLIKTLTGALFNIALNFLLIPAYGAVGSSVATLLAYLLSGYLMNYLLPPARSVFYIQSTAFGDAFKLSFLRRNLPDAP